MNRELYIGIDLGGTAIKGAVADAQGRILYTCSCATPAAEGQDKVIEQLAAIVNDCRAHAPEVKAVGVGTPGIVSPDGRTVVGAAENIAGWENVDLCNRLEKLTGLPVTATNDANAMAMAETAFGAAKGFTDAIFITVGTGIGAAAIIDGKPWRGFNGRGMELGHTTIDLHGEECACGSNGCLEQYASTSALCRNFNRLTGMQADGRLIVELYHAAHPEAIEVLNSHWNYLAHGIGSVINLFSPQLVVVGGGIVDSGSFYLDNLREQVAKHVIADCAAFTRIEKAQLGNNAGCLGAAALAIYS